MVGASAPLRVAADQVYLSEGGAGHARPAPEAQPTGSAEDGEPLEYSKFTDSEYGTGPAGQSDQTADPRTVRELGSLPEHPLALQCTVAVMRHLAEQITLIERAVHARVKLRPTFQALLTVPGIGQTLALTIMLEPGEIGRFPTVGQLASYCLVSAAPS